MFGNIDNKYPILLECELVQYEGGGGKWEIHIEAHKVVDSVGRFSQVFINQVKVLVKLV